MAEQQKPSGDCSDFGAKVIESIDAKELRANPKPLGGYSILSAVREGNELIRMILADGDLGEFRLSPEMQRQQD